MAERILWEQLRGRRLAGHRFRRQHPIGAYVLDFYCPALRPAVEADGEVHETVEQRQRDASRSRALASHGVQVLRFTNGDVVHNLPAVLRAIDLAAERTAKQRNGAERMDAQPTPGTPATGT